MAAILDDDARERQDLESQIDVYTEESIYKKFAPDHDNKLLPEFHKLDWKDSIQ